jgi:hypothetical protein
MRLQKISLLLPEEDATSKNKKHDDSEGVIAFGVLVCFKHAPCLIPLRRILILMS